jgi:hypothetical protein
VIINNVFEQLPAPVGLASPTAMMVWICQSRPSRNG